MLADAGDEGVILTRATESERTDIAAIGNAMDDFSARSPEGYINNDMRGPRGRTPPSSQRSRAAPRGFGGGARRSSIALGNEGNQARYAQFLYD